MRDTPTTVIYHGMSLSVLYHGKRVQNIIGSWFDIPWIKIYHWVQNSI